MGLTVSRRTFVLVPYRTRGDKVKKLGASSWVPDVEFHFIPSATPWFSSLGIGIAFIVKTNCPGKESKANDTQEYLRSSLLFTAPHPCSNHVIARIDPNPCSRNL